uniref:Uncharacterized protein n=1 Tax=Anguilla anguilla TaxID=7936 RepID=A0A0E9SQQ5_ANGAN
MKTSFTSCTALSWLKGTCCTFFLLFLCNPYSDCPEVAVAWHLLNLQP